MREAFPGKEELCNNDVKGVYIIMELNDKSFDPHGLGF
jgi:hypothetical protein